MSEKNNHQNFPKCMALENTKIISTNSGYKKKEKRQIEVVKLEIAALEQSYEIGSVVERG